MHPSMIPGLDGLRGIAFLLVYGLHTDYVQVGWVGVQFFFVLSGFLITGILLDMKKFLPPRDYFVKFYGRRFLRIFPLYYFYLLLMAGVATWLISIAYRPGAMKVFLEQARYAALYVYDFFFATSFGNNSSFLDHFWSLSVEEQFYIFWPLLILLVPEKALKKLSIGFIVLGPLFRLIFLFIYRSGEFSFLARSAEWFIYPLPFSHIDAFAFGALISRYPFPNAKKQFFILLGILPVVGYATQYLATGEIGAISAFGFPMFLGDAYKYIWGYSLLNYFFAVAICAVVKEQVFLRFLDWKPMQYLGKISYGLYVYHYPIIWFVGRIRDLEVPEATARVLTALIAFPVTLLISAASYHLMEKPILDLKDRFFSLKRAEKQTTAVERRLNVS
ncbi:MAG: acyltransferase family protein [Chloroflexota bacterium]|nr:acyltransferase [Anaerolineales bacterium]